MTVLDGRLYFNYHFKKIVLDDFVSLKWQSHALFNLYKDREVLTPYSTVDFPFNGSLIFIVCCQGLHYHFNMKV